MRMQAQKNELRTPKVRSNSSEIFSPEADNDAKSALETPEKEPHSPRSPVSVSRKNSLSETLDFRQRILQEQQGSCYV